MPMVFDDTHIKIENCIVVWDGITRPEKNDGGNMRWSLKVVISPSNPDLQLLQQLAEKELQTSEFRGVLPNGGIMPIGQAGPQEFNGQYPGWAVVNFSTFRAPQVVDENGRTLDAMEYGNLIYGGQVVDVIANCKAYNNKSRGVAARLDGFGIRVSQNAPRQNFGGGGVDISAAFGGGGQPQQQAPAQQPQQQQWGGQPQQQAPAQPQQQAPAPSAQQFYQQPAHPQQQWGGQPQQQAPAQQPQQQAPQQAHNWLPSQ